MRPTPIVLLTAAFAALPCATASAQLRILLADRTSGAIWTLTDRDGNGAIDASEVGLFYNAGNDAGTPGLGNPNMIGVTRDGRVLVGDQDTAARHWLLLEDKDHNGEAMGPTESRVFASRNNSSGASFAFPVGFADDGSGRLFFCNAGNGFGPDQVYIVRDQDGDGTVDGSGEISGFVTVNGFGTNGSFSPQELVFGDNGKLYLRNSSTGNHGIFCLSDNDGSGVIDQSSEFTLFWGTGNASGITASAGFAVDVDPTRPHSFYTLQIGTGAVDQLVRCTDVNSDNDAMDTDESVMAFSTAEAGFTGVDAMALRDGRVLISDNSGIRIIALRDLDGDGLFMSPGERSDFLPGALGGILQARAMAVYPCPADFNQDFNVDPDDLGDFITCFFLPTPCAAADYNHDGNINPDDLGDFITVFFGPPC